MRPKLLRNRAQCGKCKEIIESKHTHDFKWCKCGNLAVDGGLAYAKRCYGGPYKELSEYEEDEPHQA